MKIRRFSAFLIAVIMVVASLLGTFTVSAEDKVTRPSITIGKFNTAPTIDGSFSEDEWGKKSFTLAEGEANVTAHKEKSGEEELPLTKTVTDVYMGYDEANLYLCVVADYAKHSAQALLGSKLWADDCLQTKISATQDGPYYNDIDFGLNTTTNRALAHVWNGNGVTYGQLQPGKGKDFMIVRAGTKTVYEIKYPLKSFASNVLKLKQGDKIAFSMAQHMSNKGGFYEFAGGIVNSKEITSAGILVLGEAKNLPARPNNNSTTEDASNTSSNTSAATSNNDKTENNNESAVEGNVEDTSSNTSDDTASNSDSNAEAEEEVIIEEVVEEGNSGKFPIGVIVGVLVGVVAILGVAFYFLIIRKR
ncbi:MAG: hypothetical protein IKK24_02685 [Clostridia bacterium]|nr:hypothetical protein [Clostridia bacterium]